MPMRFSVQVRIKNRRPSRNALPNLTSRHRIRSQPVEIDRLVVHHPTPQQVRVASLYRTCITPQTSSRELASQRAHSLRSNPPSYSSIHLAPTRASPPPITADQRPPRYQRKDPHGTRWRRFRQRLQFYCRPFVLFTHDSVSALLILLRASLLLPALLLCLPCIIFEALLGRNRHQRVQT